MSKQINQNYLLLFFGIRDSQTNNYYSPGFVNTFSSLNREYVINAFRDADLRIKNYFGVANTVGLIINSMIDIFSSEIEKIEKDIQILEDFINNYEYLSGKDDLYNSNYVEKFDNFLHDYKSDGVLFDLVDRDGNNFDQNGNGFIDTKSGVFKIGNNAVFKNVIGSVKSIDLKTNYEFIEHTSTDVNAVLTETLSDSWSVSVKSPTIIKSKIDEVSKYCAYDTSLISGAQACMTINFDYPQVMDTIYITPNYSNGLQLLQVLLFNEEDDLVISMPVENIELLNTTEYHSENRGFIPVLSSPILLEDTIEVPFEKAMVKKIILIFNQSAYQKNQTVTISNELVSRKIYDAVKHIRQERKKNTDKLQDLVYSIFLKNNSVKEFFKNNSYVSNYYSYRYPCISEMPKSSIYSNQLVEDLKENGLFDRGSSSIISNMFQNFLSHVIDHSGQIFDQSIFIESNSSRGNLFNFKSAGLFPSKKSNLFGDSKHQSSNIEIVSRSSKSSLLDLLAQEKVDQYEYNFSIKSIDFATINRTTQNKKACFVSRKIPLNGHAVAVKIKLLKDKSNLDLNSYSYDLKEPTSYELSVSNIEIPDNELDWIPLVNAGETSISSEVLFFDPSTRTARTRFAVKADSFSLYENGISVKPEDYKIFNKTISLLSPIKPNTVYVASYDLDSASYNYGVVDFLSNGMLKETTKPAYSSGGAGELFAATDSLNRVTLQDVPYINDAFVQTAVYSPFLGTVFTTQNSGYNPVKVLLADGSYAINLTNYTKSRDSATFSGQNSGVYFIQNGKEIIFNQKISQPFRVIYDYVPNSLRFRLIIRNNISNMNFSGSADAVVVKCKTKIYDPFYDKLTQVIYKN